MQRKPFTQLTITILLTILIAIILAPPFVALCAQTDRTSNISSHGSITYSTPTTTSNGLHIEGNKLKDADGNTVILRGVDDSITTWWDASVGYNNDQFTYMKNWGCNAVRINIGMWDITDGCYSNSAFLSRLDTQVNYAIANGIIPIICGWHAIPEDGSVYVSSFMTPARWIEYQNVYRMLAQRYAGKGVIYEMYNEPLYCNLATYKAQMEATIDAIRTYDSNAIVIVQAVGTGDWDTQNLNFVTQGYAINREGVIYCAHIYAWQTSENTAASIRSKLSSGYYNLYACQALVAGYPVIFTEFGCGGTGDAGTIASSMNSWSETWLNNFMTVCDSDGYSGYTTWRWCTSAYDQPWNLLADWNGNPTYYGETIRDYYLAN